MKIYISMVAGMAAMAQTSGIYSNQETVKREGKKIGRNEPCPCKSGKKYKKCCLNP